MTKFLSNLIVGSIWFGLVVLASGSEVIPVYGSELITILFSAMMISVIVTLLGLVAIVLGTIGGAVLGAIGSGDSVGVGATVGMIFGVIATYTFEFFLIRDILPDHIEWFPAITGTWVMVYMVVGFLISLIRIIDEKKK